MKFGLIFKIVLMAVALIFVLRGIGVLRSDKFVESAKNPNSLVNLFVGDNQSVTNWCPQKVEFLELVENRKKLETPKDFALICEVMMAPYEEPQNQKFEFKPIVKAIGQTEIVLEKAEGYPVFRVKDMPFSSPGLDTHLKRLLAE